MTDEKRVQITLGMAARWGQLVGARQKAWVIDQMVRILVGDKYDEWVAAQKAGRDGPETYGWDEGISP